jgi:hypothetical protein
MHVLFEQSRRLPSSSWTSGHTHADKGMGLYALCSVVPLITISVTLGMLVLIVELLDYLLSLLERRRRFKAIGGTRISVTL